MPKSKTTKKGRSQRRNNDPLVQRPGALSDSTAKKRREKEIQLRDEQLSEPSQQMVDGKSTSKIMKMAREEQNELFGGKKDFDFNNDEEFPSLGGGGGGDDDFEEDDMEEQYEDFDGGEDALEIDDDDTKTLNAFASGEKRLNLADLIMQKIESKKNQVDEIIEEEQGGPVNELPEELIAHYSSIGRALSTFRSGKLPKTFKLLPRLTNWEDILDVMAPDKWSAAAMFQATRMFASNMSEGLVQRFYNIYLLPRIRDDIQFYKKLSFHMMQCLKKALYKPAAFFKGILIPLCQDNDTCTLREAAIICACLREHSIPPLHAAAGLLKIAEMDYNGVNSLFLRVLLEKKYALPFRVLDGLVFHFLKFRQEKRQLPVLWHQSLLVFVSIYAADISEEQKEALLDLLKHQAHAQIGEECRRQLMRTAPRDEEMAEPPAHVLEEMLTAGF